MKKVPPVGLNWASAAVVSSLFKFFLTSAAGSTALYLAAPGPGVGGATFRWTQGGSSFLDDVIIVFMVDLFTWVGLVG